MFVDTMSSTSLLQEYLADSDELQELAYRFNRSRRVSDYLRKRKKSLQAVITKVFRTERYNRYLGIFLYSRAKHRTDWDLQPYFVGLMDTHKGTATIAFFKESERAVKFTPHFFRRYRERFLAVCDWQTRNQLANATSIEDLAAIYIRRNLGIIWIETSSVFRDKVHIFAPVNDGVALLQYDKERKLLQANTFVTMDMLDERQTQMVEYAKVYFQMPKRERELYQFPDFMYDSDEKK